MLRERRGKWAPGPGPRPGPGTGVGNTARSQVKKNVSKQPEKQSKIRQQKVYFIQRLQWDSVRPDSQPVKWQVFWEPIPLCSCQSLGLSFLVVLPLNFGSCSPWFWPGSRFQWECTHMLQVPCFWMLVPEWRLPPGFLPLGFRLQRVPGTGSCCPSSMAMDYAS